MLTLSLSSICMQFRYTYNCLCLYIHLHMIKGLMRCLNASYAPGGLRVRPKLNPLSLNYFPNSTH